MNINVSTLQYFSSNAGTNLNSVDRMNTSLIESQLLTKLTKYLLVIYIFRCHQRTHRSSSVTTLLFWTNEKFSAALIWRWKRKFRANCMRNLNICVYPSQFIRNKGRTTKTSSFTMPHSASQFKIAHVLRTKLS